MRGLVITALAFGLAFGGSAVNATTCVPTGYVRDGLNLTARQIGGTVTGTLDATGCHIGVYYSAVAPGAVTNADIFGATYFGVLVNGATVDVRDSSVHDIGESPFNGSQHGVGIYYRNGASGTVAGNQVSAYQKGGITANDAGTEVSVINNTVTGLGRVDFIAQNGIQFGWGARVVALSGNTVTGNHYTQGASRGWVSAGILLYQAVLDGTVGDVASANRSFRNQANIFYIQ